MKIKFIGTSHGVPAADRHCQCILVETGASLYIIDAGAPVIDCLLRSSYNLTALKAVFITHCHGDHTNGLIPLADLAGWYFNEMSFESFFPEQNVAEAVINYLNCTGNINTYGSERLPVSIVREGALFDDGNLKVTAYPTNHISYQNRPAFGYLLEADGKKVYVSGDLSHNLEDYPQIANQTELDAFIVECAHFPAEKLIENLKSTKAAKVLVTHVFPLEKYDVFKSAINDLPCEMLFPEDNDEYDIV